MGMTDIKLIPLRCPDCGKDIQSGEDDLVHFCSNCGSGYEIALGKFKKVNVIFVKPEKEFENKKLYYLPMWQILSKITVKKKQNIDVSQLPPEILSNEQFTSFFVGLLNKEKPVDKMIFFVPAFGVTNRYQLMEEWTLREISRESPMLVRLAGSLGYRGEAMSVRKSFTSDWDETARSVRELVEKYFYQ